MITLPPELSPRRWAIRAVAQAEQEIRAYPRLHAAFYTVITRNPALRELAGRAKARVRGTPPPGAEMLPPDDHAVAQRRLASLAVRLGLDPQDLG